MNTIDKINEIIANTYTIEIKSYTDVHVDSYEHGELEYANGFANPMVTFNTQSECLETDLKQYLTDYLTNTLDIDYKGSDLLEVFESAGKEDSFWFNKFVDSENTTPSDYQRKMWKQDEMKLYNQSINTSISVNGIELPSNLILEIFSK